MVFRTGSVLIAGKCDETVLIIIYEFLKVVLHNEFANIFQKTPENYISNSCKNKHKKIRKKTIMFNI